MPVHNAEKFLGDAAESILNQTYPHFEFIIIEDCSSDGSYKLAEKYAVEDLRIRLFKNKENKRLPATLNYGIEQASGKYIARMDADDISISNRLAIQVSYMEAHPVVLGRTDIFKKFKYSLELAGNAEDYEL